MDSRVSAFKATQSYLDQQIKMWTNSNRLIGAAFGFGELSNVSVTGQVSRGHRTLSERRRFQPDRGRDPAPLVQIMYEELLKALDAMAFATARGDYVQRGERQSKALAILTGLETSLDFDKGGQIAVDLVAIYREARRLVIAGGREGDAALIIQAREMIQEISTAWDGIGQRG